MKKSMITGALVFFMFVFSLNASTAKADYLKIVGPNGTQVNGYYTGSVTFTGEGDHFYTSYRGSSCDSVEHRTDTMSLGAPLNTQTNDKWYSYFEGTHTYKIIGDQYSNGWYQKDSDEPINVFSLFGCPLGYSYENAKVLWSGELKIDRSEAPRFTRARNGCGWPKSTSDKSVAIIEPPQPSTSATRAAVRRMLSGSLSTLITATDYITSKREMASSEAQLFPQVSLQHECAGPLSYAAH
jgi:hypothetical protein